MTLICNCESDDYRTLVITLGDNANLKYFKRNKHQDNEKYNLLSDYHLLFHGND